MRRNMMPQDMGGDSEAATYCLLMPVLIRLGYNWPEISAAKNLNYVPYTSRPDGRQVPCLTVVVCDMEGGN